MKQNMTPNHTDKMSLEEKVAQCIMIGFSGADIQHPDNTIFREFLTIGVGGVIFFGPNCTPCRTGHDINALITSIHDYVPPHLPKSFIAIDQEGGPVERLPHTCFPTGVSPYALSKSSQPQLLTQAQYRLIASHLNTLGFTMNFFPTLDVNLDPDNPIIGIRSFGENPEGVWDLAKIAMNAHLEFGVLSCGKHYPGHGNGKIDSHISLPTLNFTPEEYSVFKNAIKANIPAMMVSHGFYPALQTAPEENQCPASLSQTIITQKLIQEENYQGLIISDDMTMGAALQHGKAEEAAIQGFNAGLDILIYNQSTETEWNVLNTLVKAVKTGLISEEKLNHSVNKILNAKNQLHTASHHKNLNTLTADEIAQQAITYTDPKKLLPLQKDQSIQIIAPNRSYIHHYQFDATTGNQSPELEAHLLKYGYTHVEQEFYHPFHPELSIDSKNTADVFIWLDYHSHRIPEQEQYCLNQLKKYQNPKTMIVTLGMPNKNLIAQFDCHLLLANYRPASIQALAQTLSSR